jgi:hypothetical protein
MNPIHVASQQQQGTEQQQRYIDYHPVHTLTIANGDKTTLHVI